MIASVFTSILVGVAVLLVVLCALGVAVMRDPLQRLHYLSPPATLSATLVVIAVWVDDHDWQARFKVIVVAVLLACLNGVVTHATARACRVRAAAEKESSS